MSKSRTGLPAHLSVHSYTIVKNKDKLRQPSDALYDEEMIKRYGQSSGTSNEDFHAAINAIANAMGQTGSGGGAGGSWGPGSLTPPVPSHIPTE